MSFIYSTAYQGDVSKYKVNGKSCWYFFSCAVFGYICGSMSNMPCKKCSFEQTKLHGVQRRVLKVTVLVNNSL